MKTSSGHAHFRFPVSGLDGFIFFEKLDFLGNGLKQLGCANGV